MSIFEVMTERLRW